MHDQKPSEFIPDETLISKIYLIRNQKVMLDRDLAVLYGIKPRRLREQVRRNLNRFPENFMFQLTDYETVDMVSQNAIPSRQHLGGTLPYAFTEHGILMLANVLKSEIAVQMSIRIIELFIKFREFIITQKDLLLKLEILENKILNQQSHLIRHEEEIQILFDAIKQLISPPSKSRTQIGFKQNEQL